MGGRLSVDRKVPTYAKRVAKLQKALDYASNRLATLNGVIAEFNLEPAGKRSPEAVATSRCWLAHVLHDSAHALLESMGTIRYNSRNACVAALADRLLVAHAAPGGKTERLCRDALAGGKQVYTLESSDNAHLIAGGAVPVAADDPSAVTALTHDNRSSNCRS